LFVTLDLLANGAAGSGGSPDSGAMDNKFSPPRFIAEDHASHNLVVPVGRSAASQQKIISGVPGKALSMSDEELVELLRKPPKSTLVLRTKTNFQEFFNGIDATKMRLLLNGAYSDIADEAERNAKVNKRMELLGGCT
jgi:hypothetical protein